MLYMISNDLFPLPTEGGEGVGDPIQTLPLFQHRYPVRDGYILGVTALVRTIDGFIQFVCPCLRPAGTRCKRPPSCLGDHRAV